MIMATKMTNIFTGHETNPTFTIFLFASYSKWETVIHYELRTKLLFYSSKEATDETRNKPLLAVDLLQLVS